MNTETIAAIATAAGSGGIGVIRVSGPKARAIGEIMTGSTLLPRHALFADFKNAVDNVIDQGIAIYFSAPHSFTGEDVVELQGHGNRFVLDDILQRTLSLGARLAKPGEFSERAFLNNKIDLAQAEAIADIIESTNASAARNAVQSLSGEFSKKIHALLEALTQLRTYIEATIDFPEEDIDLKTNAYVQTALSKTVDHLQAVLRQAKQGSIIRDGLSLIIVGEPNTGKSSLLNKLAGDDIAIVSEQAGTTRDMLRETIMIDGLPLKLIDTAGLRISLDEIEQEGIRRAGQEVERADIIFYLQDCNVKHVDLQPSRHYVAEQLAQYKIALPKNTLLVVVNNKIDLKQKRPEVLSASGLDRNYAAVAISAKEALGLDLLAEQIRLFCGLSNHTETSFTARRRHLDILERCHQQLLLAFEQPAAELLAEDLRLTQHLLGEITGAFSSNELLGEIFSSFCIGK
ncbi:MAG: tRNA uridine-5-carboxymethylaminomethyl(34) synthesis GTPase MnmE [Pseudomonadales bacterium]|nr:tRNA uridine-5-carboxymethylaminomethyl(34) synthesis GTPase MnmE [Pseudomonadales bacterium]